MRPALMNMYINKQILIKILFTVGMMFFILPATSYQQYSSNKIKAAYIYNFIKYIEWPNDENIVNLAIGYYGDEKEYHSALQEMQGRKIRHFNISFIKITSIEQINTLHIVVLDKAQSRNINKISKQLNGQATLIVSDHTIENKYSMLNFMNTNENKLIFELNRYQMLNAQLKVSPDILVLGGTELDIANVLKEMDVTITNSLIEIKEQSNKLNQLEKNITDREVQLTLHQRKLATQQKKLTSQRSQLEIQSEQLKQNKKEFKTLQDNYSLITRELDISQIQLTNNMDNLQSLQKDTSQKEQVISRLESQIDERKVLLNNLESQHAKQKQKLTDQSTIIQTQYIVLIITAIASFAILIVLIALYMSKKTQHKVNQELQVNIAALAESNLKLSNTQVQLVESEKMAALGGLVAGIAHEINTPIGVSVTATSHLADQIDLFDKEYKAGILKKSSLEELLIDAKDSSGILTRNLQRASKLINNFKQVAVDQSSEDRRNFELHTYIDELTQSLRPQFKQSKHSIQTTSNSKIEINNFPGVIAQIITNLIMNSLNHGFRNKTHGEILITLALENNEVVIEYRDNGIGLTEQQRKKVFDPFYTTARSTGGSGLGMSISYNLITSKLHGSIKCMEASEGAYFRILFPL